MREQQACDAYHSNDGLKLVGRQAQTNGYTTNGRVRGGYIWVGTKIQVQHGGIGSLHQYPLATVICIVDHCNSVANIWQHLQHSTN